MIRRVSLHLDHQPATQTAPYRKAVLHIKAVLEKAQKGDVAVPHVPDDPLPQAAKAVGIGERVTDFAVSGLTEEKTARFQNYQGKPILVFFYNPTTPLGKEVLTYVKQLSEKQTGRLEIMAMAVTNDADVAKKQHQEMRLLFPIFDGNGLRLTFGAEQTPRFVVVDSSGLVRLAQTGWGFQPLETTLRSPRLPSLPVLSRPYIRPESCKRNRENRCYARIHFLFEAVRRLCNDLVSQGVKTIR
jgi:peroxiredoxin